MTETVAQAAELVPDHHNLAEKSLHAAAEYDYGSDRERYELGCAQVHALLSISQELRRIIAKLEALDD
jgi:hypothetical protein